jgi:hypothetical protein
MQARLRAHATLITVALAYSIVPTLAFSQAAAPAAAGTAAKEEVLQLSPYVVNAEEETGWTATQSLAGSRLRTDLKDIAAPIEVLTKDFMDDFALNSIAEATIYTTNVEGTGDNLEAATGVGTGTGFPPPTRIRGLGNGTLSRDFFAVNMPSDNYNLDRVTIASGPNNLLFGTGSPSGVIDTSLKRAIFKSFIKVDTQFDSNGSSRVATDINQEIIPQKLAVRFDYLHDEKEYYLKPAGTDQDRYYGTIQWRPFKKTSISVHYEDAKVNNSSPQLLLPWDQVSPWFTAASSGFTGPGMNVNMPTYTNPSVTGSWVASTVNNTIFGRDANNPTFVIGNAGAVAGKTYNYNNTAEVRSPRFYPSVNGLNNEADGYTLLDGTYYPLDLNLSGLSRQQKVHSKISNVFFTQQLGENLFVEAAMQRERYDTWIGGFGGYVGGNTLKVDPNKYMVDGVTANPNYGKYYVEGGVFRQNQRYESNDWRVGISYEKDFTRSGGSWWRKLLGKQRLGGLVSHNDNLSLDGEYDARLLPDSSGKDPVVTGLTLLAPYAANGTTKNNNWAINSSRTLRVRYYLSDRNDVPSFPGPDYTGAFNYVDSAGTPHTIDMLNTGLTDSAGRRLGTNRTNSLLKSKLDTQQLSYQGFFWGNRLVTTLGWRRDKANGANPANGGAAADPWTGLHPILDDITFDPYDPANAASGTTTTKGFVVRPLAGIVKLPLGADISLKWNRSNTFQPDVSNRDPYGKRVKGATGKGEDKSIVLGLFDGKFNVQYTKFDNTAGPARAGNVPYNRFRFTAAGPINRITSLAYGLNNYNIDPAYPDMWPTLGSGDPYWVTSDQHASGSEINLQWNVTKNFEIRFGMNKQTVVESNIGTDWWAFLDVYLPKWQALTFPEGGVNNPRDLDGNGKIDTWTWNTAWRADNNSQTVADWWQQEAIAGSTGKNIIQGLDGKSNDFVRDNRYNINWIYRFDEGRLKGLSIGGAFRHRAAPLLSYGKKTVPSGDAFDLSNALYGKVDNYVDLSFNYRAKTKLLGMKNYRVGLNIRNVLDKSDTYPRLLNVSGNVIRMQRVAEPRVFILSLGFEL